MSTGGRSSSRSCARTTAIGRPTRPATCSLPSAAKLSTVHSVVSMARSSADRRSRAARRRPSGAPSRAAASAATSAAAKSPSASCAGARPWRGPASAGPSRPAAISHITPPLTGSCSSSPMGEPSTPNSSRLSSRWSGITKPATGLTCSAVSIWSTRASVPSAPDGRCRIDEAEQPARRPQQARAHRQRAGPCRAAWRAWA